MNPEDKLRKIFDDARHTGILTETDAANLHEQVLALEIDMMLDLAAAQHEVQQLQEQRDATRLYLGVRLSPNDVAPGEEEPVETIRHILTKIMDEYSGKKIQQIKEVRSSEELALAWTRAGGLGVSSHTDWQGNQRAGFGLKEAKDIIDEAWQNGSVRVGKALVKL